MEHMAAERLGPQRSKTRESLAKLRLLLRGEPNLDARDDTEFLLAFLQHTDFNEDLAYVRMKKYYRNRAVYPKVFDNLVPSNEMDALSKNVIATLPGLDKHGRPVLLLRLGKWDTKTPQHLLNRVLILWFDHLSSSLASQMAGVTLLVDFDDCKPTTLFSFELGLIKQIIQYLHDCLPVSVRQIHVVRQLLFFNVFFTLIRPFLSKDEVQMFQLHGHNYERLYGDIPKENLPSDYGGDIMSIDFDGLYRNLRMKDKEFIENNRYGYIKKC